MSLWKAGLLVVVLSGVGGFGCGGMEPVEDSSTSATARYLEQLEDDDGHPNQCGKKTCFDIERDKNITHIFLDFGDCPVEDVRVFLTTPSRGTEEVTDRLKSRGGPCQQLDADYRFEVQGPDREARVCLIFQDYVTDDVRIGAKSANECRYEDDSLRAFGDKDCRRCKKDH